jgi:hypothetical protein
VACPRFSKRRASQAAEALVDAVQAGMELDLVTHAHVTTTLKVLFQRSQGPRLGSV